MFYASPVIIPVTTVQWKLSPTLLHIYMLNPLAVAFQQFRHAFVKLTQRPASANSSAQRLRSRCLSLSCWRFSSLGFWVFNRIAPRVAEDL